MNDYSFYKSLYDRELNRRVHFDNSINLPVTILTLIVGLNYYYIKNIGIKDINEILFWDYSGFLLVSILFLTSLFFLIKSYNNLFRGFSYRNLATPSEIADFKNELDKYNDQVDEKVSFESVIVEKLNQVSDNHILINDQRSIDLYRCKTFIILTLIASGLNIIILTIKNLQI
ncbi:hypothetical protein [Christiangramia sabulilitoris]|uniref:Uncharacterized protein n=1 Tax=Christiangramia sabulilitoris TaxID=2583991 RepID=A0A550I738_9FLAO|nr:hypothetical protein [Christiangramia sabulilitoris]TRO66786.1 hypothetical protein FGM01_02530 [Christiangramia sabulilitoris]